MLNNSALKSGGPRASTLSGFSSNFFEGLKSTAFRKIFLNIALKKGVDKIYFLQLVNYLADIKQKVALISALLFTCFLSFLQAQKYYNVDQVSLMGEISDNTETLYERLPGYLKEESHESRFGD